MYYARAHQLLPRTLHYQHTRSTSIVYQSPYTDPITPLLLVWVSPYFASTSRQPPQSSPTTSADPRITLAIHQVLRLPIHPPHFHLSTTNPTTTATPRRSRVRLPCPLLWQPHIRSITVSRRIYTNPTYSESRVRITKISNTLLYCLLIIHYICSTPYSLLTFYAILSPTFNTILSTFYTIL